MSGFNSRGSSSKSDGNDAFSRPIVRRRFQATLGQQIADDNTLPSVSSEEPNVLNNQVFSPPVSIPETSSDGNAETQNLSDDDEPEVESLSQSSTSSLNRKLESSKITPEEVPSRTAKKARCPYDLEEEEDSITQPIQKRKKEDEFGGAKFIPKKDKKPVYHHKWTNDDEEDEDDELEPKPVSSSRSTESRQRIPERNSHQQRKPINSRPVAPSTSSHIAPYKPRVRNVKDPNEILESGEYDDFKHDLDYTLSSLNKRDAPKKVKCLSAISLAKKCVSPEFRQFLKSDGRACQVFRALHDSPEDPSFALAASTVIYLLSRDFNSIKIDFGALKMISQLLRIDSIEKSDENMKTINSVWDIFKTYLEKQETSGKKIAFDMKLEHITPSTLIIESLVFISTRCNNDAEFKEELLKMGILHFIVAKVEGLINEIEKGTNGDAPNVLILDRCFRILEMCSMLHKRNQAFLISHRQGVLINVLSKFLQLIHEKVPLLEEENVKKYMNCLALMGRVLINLSHENELCCTKLGQISGFLPTCLSIFTYLAPKYADSEKKFDILVMISSLLTNLVERCNVNRRQLISVTVKMVSKTGTIEETESLKALSQLFVYHESKAKTIDEDLDRDLVLDDAAVEGENDDESSDDEDGARRDGRLDRNKLENMDEADMMNAVQQVMKKANAHMEDSIVASYIALLVGCLLQQNEDQSDIIREFLPDKSYASMIAQLQRFAEFMKVAMAKKSDSQAGLRSIDKILDFLERLD